MALIFFEKAKKGGKKQKESDVTVTLCKNTHSTKKYSVNITIREFPKQLQKTKYVRLALDDKNSSRLYIIPSENNGYTLSRTNGTKNASVKVTAHEQITEWAKERAGDFCWKYDTENDFYYIVPKSDKKTSPQKCYSICPTCGRKLQKEVKI